MGSSCQEPRKLTFPNLPNRLTAQQIIARAAENQKLKRNLIARILETGKKSFETFADSPKVQKGPPE
jgi:hypothetical protein